MLKIMETGPLITVFIGCAIVFCFVALTFRAVKRSKNISPQTHQAHKPNTGYDRAEAIRKGVMGDNGHDV
jgi:hypothetical protein